MLDDATKVKEFGGTPIGVSVEADGGIDSDGSHDNPVLDTEDREKSVAWGSGDMHEVYTETFSTALEKSMELVHSDELAGKTERAVDW